MVGRQERPQEYTFGDLLPSNSWVLSLQHPSLLQGALHMPIRHPAPGLTASGQWTVAANHRLGQLTVGLKSALGYFAQKSHHSPLTYFLTHKAEMVTVTPISPGISSVTSHVQTLARNLYVWEGQLQYFHLHIKYVTLCVQLCLVYRARCHLPRAQKGHPEDSKDSWEMGSRQLFPPWPSALIPPNPHAFSLR